MRLLKVGRDSSCDIVLNSPRVSALHAEITVLNNGDILLEDKDSTNGTYIMNRPIKPHTQVSIKYGDAIRFADVELIWNQVPLPDTAALLGYKAVLGIGTNFRNDIRLSEPTVSRFHATLKIDKKGHATLEDHSKNGTLVNGQRIGHGQSVAIGRKDSVVCGGVPVDLSPYLPSAPIWTKLARVAAVLVVLIAVVFGASKVVPPTHTITPKTSQAMEYGTALVYGAFYYVVTIKDDPFVNFKGWPYHTWYFGVDSKGNLVCSPDKEDNEMTPLEYTGTAFFISCNGELGTNRHIAVPWEYGLEEYGEAIRQMMAIVRRQLTAERERWVLAYYAAGQLSEREAIAYLERYALSDIEITGVSEYLGIALTGTNVNSLQDLQSCQLIAESGDAKKDVALIRLNSRKTPDYLVQMGAIYDIEQARVDEKSLDPQEELTTIGYPWGFVVTNEHFDGKELHPTIHKTSPSKVPDDNNIQIQTVAVGGQSGSPVIDKKHRLVGVLASGFRTTEMTYCCNIKHLKELYDKYKVGK